MTQLIYLKQDLERMVGKSKFRWFIIWMTRAFVGVFFYRIERAFFLLFGDVYKYIRILFLPILLLAQAYSNLDINYKANVKGGLLILHPAMGCVISGYCNIGENLTLTGGNIIGVKSTNCVTEFKLGNCLNLGANAVIVGPLILADHIKIGASACVVNSFDESFITLIGVPAKLLKN